MDVKDFLLWEQASRQTIDFKVIYVDMANEDIEGGLLLSQILYWHLPSKETGKSKLRVKKEGHLWLAKGREDWYEETRLKPKRVDKAMKILVDNKIIEKKTFKLNANPTTHIRVLWDNFLDLFQEKMHSQPLGDMVIPETGKTNFPNREKGNSPNGNNDITKTGISLTKITDKDFDIDFNKENTTTSNRDKIDSELKEQFPNVNFELAKQQAFEQFEIKTDKQYYASVFMKLTDLAKQPKKKKAPTIRKEMIPNWLNEEEKIEEKQPELEKVEFEKEMAKLIEQRERMRQAKKEA